MGPKLKPVEVNGWFVVLVILAAISSLLGLVASIGWFFNPLDPRWVILPRYGWSFSSFFVGVAIATYLRRDPNTPTRRKDLARPIVAGVSVGVAIAASAVPILGVVAVLGVALGTVASVSTNPWWNDDLSAPIANAGAASAQLPAAVLEPAESLEAEPAEQPESSSVIHRENTPETPK